MSEELENKVAHGGEPTSVNEPNGVNSALKPFVEIKDLVKNYYLLGKEIKVLKGLNAVINAGEMISITGLSGVGKSTLLQVLGTIDRPTSGSVLFEGMDIFNFNDKQLAAFRNKTVGFVFQFHHLLPDFSALENVMMPAIIAGWQKKHAEETAVDALEKVGLSQRLLHNPGELSGGEQQRVAIARALVMRPKIVLADEPTGNLDEKTASELHELLFALNKEYKMTLVIVTHSTRLASTLPRRWRMGDGVIIQDECD